jgi:small subunit ribosomal protein S8
MVDPISDMLTRIRNAQAVGYQTVNFPFSKIKFELANIFSKQGFLGNISKKGRGIKREIELVLKYKDEKSTIPFIQGLKKISKPGQRIYANKKELNKFIKEQGITILSTSQGLMIAQEARKKGLGGEVLCRVW